MEFVIFFCLVVMLLGVLFTIIETYEIFTEGKVRKKAIIHKTIFPPQKEYIDKDYIEAMLEVDRFLEGKE